MIESANWETKQNEKKKKKTYKRSNIFMIFSWFLVHTVRHVNTFSHTHVFVFRVFSLLRLVYILIPQHTSPPSFGIKCIVMFDRFLLIYLFIARQTKSIHYNHILGYNIILYCRVRSFLLTLLRVILVSFSSSSLFLQ